MGSGFGGPDLARLESVFTENPNQTKWIYHSYLKTWGEELLGPDKDDQREIRNWGLFWFPSWMDHVVKGTCGMEEEDGLCSNVPSSLKWRFVHSETLSPWWFILLGLLSKTTWIAGEWLWILIGLWWRAMKRETPLSGLARLYRFSISVMAWSYLQLFVQNVPREQIQTAKKKGFRNLIAPFENLINSWTVFPETINIHKTQILHIIFRSLCVSLPPPPHPSPQKLWVVSWLASVMIWGPFLVTGQWTKVCAGMLV